MSIFNKLLLAAPAALMLTAAAGIPAQVMAAETVTKTTVKTVVAPAPVASVKAVNFMAFDHNQDGILSMEEVGEKLFFIFDRDGNEVIDNIEFDTNSMMTVTPMKKETITMVDIYADGDIEQTTYTYENFMQESQLIRFAKDHNGLSPREFINASFLQLDDNKDKTIDLQEWKEAYIAMTIPAVAEQERYN